MYRDDHEALQHRADSVSREAARLDAENAAMRAAMRNAAIPRPPLPAGVQMYRADIRNIPLAERPGLAAHQLTRFSVFAVGLLNVVTLGIFPLIHFGMMHDRLPKAAHDDPSAGKAIGYTFIPYYNLYWIFFNALRLSDRLDLQFRLRNLPTRSPRSMLLTACIFGVIPYVNFVIGIPIIWTIAVCMLQSSVNKAAALSPDDWDATPSPFDRASQAAVAHAADPAAAPAPVFAPPPVSNEVAAAQARAKRFVNWSHILGWGGLGVLLVGTSTAAIAGGATAAAMVGGLSGTSIIVGAVLGQIGRGMQGRAI